MFLPRFTLRELARLVRFNVSVAALVSAVSLGALVGAQDRENSVPTLADLQEQWTTIDQSLTKAQEQLAAGEGDADDLRSKYTNLVDEANALIDKIREAAIDRIKTTEGKDQAAIRLLMGILLNSANEGNDAEILSTGDFLIDQNINPIWFETAAKSQRIPIEAREIFDELLIRQRQAKADDLPHVKISTTKGEIIVELFENEAPETVGNFISLVEDGFYKDIDFHRVLEGFMAQTGCPEGTGMGGPGYTIECECYTPEARPHFSGSLSMAHAGKDTGGSQFFLTFERTSMLDGRHTVFGRVIEGLDVLENIQRTHLQINGREEEIPDIKKDKILSAEVIRKREHTYRPNKVGVDEPPLEEKPADESDKTDGNAENSAAEDQAKETSTDGSDSVDSEDASDRIEEAGKGDEAEASDTDDTASE